MGEFTVDWFDSNREPLLHTFAPFQGQPGVRMLEIGADEGRATVWFLENVLTGEGSHLTSVDTWQGSTETDPNAMDAVRERFRRDTETFVETGRLTVVASQSQTFLAGQIARGETAPGKGFHIISVDGSHAAPDVLSDAVLSWALLEPAGVMVFDDYIWTGMTTEQERPRFAIDSFLACFLGQYDEMHRGAQIIIRRHGPGAPDPQGTSASAAEDRSVDKGIAASPKVDADPQRRRRGKRSRR